MFPRPRFGGPATAWLPSRGCGSVWLQRLVRQAPLKHHLWHPFQPTIRSLGSRPCSLQHLTLPRPRFGRRATAGLPSRGRGSVWLQRLVRQAPHIISSTNSNHNSKLKFSTMHSSALYVPTATIRWSSNCLTTQSWLWECVVAAAGEASPSQTSSLASISTQNSKLRFSTLQSSALSARTATTWDRVKAVEVIGSKGNWGSTSEAHGGACAQGQAEEAVMKDQWFYKIWRAIMGERHAFFRGETID